MPTWRTVVGGSRTYVDKVASAIRARGHIHVDAQVSAITRGKNVQLTVNGEVHEFDHVVVACHSDQALALLTDPTTAETEVLGAIRYQDNQVTLHWDEKILPRRKRAWAAWNYHDSGEQKALATLTYNISLLQHIKAKRNFLVSLNSRHEIDQDKVLAEFNYAHPVIDQQTIRAQRRRREINTATTSFCGAYFGFGFHEDGARSASEVFAHIEGLTTRD
jgi:predicted NAD/FAD-binding protein